MEPGLPDYMSDDRTENCCLTGLDAASFIEQVNRTINRTKVSNSCEFAVLYMDLDRFKVINDSIGHSAGDKLLISVYDRVKGALRGGDIIAHMGADKFALLLDDLSDGEEEPVARLIAGRLQAVFSKPFEIEDKEVFASAGMGIALCKRDYNQAEDMLRDAVTALTRAKGRGAGQVQIFDAAIPGTP